MGHSISHPAEWAVWRSLPESCFVFCLFCGSLDGFRYWFDRGLGFLSNLRFSRCLCFVCNSQVSGLGWKNAHKNYTMHHNIALPWGCRKKPQGLCDLSLIPITPRFLGWAGLGWKNAHKDYTTYHNTALPWGCTKKIAHKDCVIYHWLLYGSQGLFLISE